MIKESQTMMKLAVAVKHNQVTDQLAQQCAATEIELLSNDLNQK